MEEKTVLCVFGERKRPVTFQASDADEERKSLLKAAKAAFADVLIEDRSYFLQYNSAEWGGLIDISGFVEDHATVHLCYSDGESSKQVCIP